MLGNTIDLGYVLEIHSQITDAERYRLLTSEGPRNVLLLDTIRQNRRKFLKSWLQDERFSNWLVYTQLSGGGGLCKTCILMQNMHLDASASDTWQSCERCFRQKTLHRFQEIYRKGSFSLGCRLPQRSNIGSKEFISSLECGKDVYTCIDAGRAQRTAENKKNLTSIVKTVLFCASNNIPLRGHSADKGNFMKLLPFRMDAGDEALKKHFAQMTGNAKYTSPTIQNQILGIASTMVVEEIAMKVLYLLLRMNPAIFWEKNNLALY